MRNNMSEKEKMLNCEWYLPFTPELSAEREACRDIIFEYNNTNPHEKERRHELLEKLFCKKLENPFIEPTFRCDYGYNIELGKNVYFNFNCVILDCNKVKIGDNTFIGPNVQIYTAIHPIEYEKRIKGQECAKPVFIGNNCWIGGSAVILPGVVIGDNTVIGAGAVVTKNIPPNSIAVGNPARVIKNIY